MAQKRLGALWGAAAAVILLTAGQVRADDFPWSYSGTSTAVLVGSSTVNFIGQASNITGNSGVVAFNLSSSSNALPGSADHLEKIPYTLNIAVTDTSAVGSGTETSKLTFTGQITADISKSSVQGFANTFTSATHGSLLLGDDPSGWRQYDVVLDSFTPPGPGKDDMGALHATVTVTPVYVPGHGADAPEPAGLLLAILGLAALALPSWPRRLFLSR